VEIKLDNKKLASIFKFILGAGILVFLVLIYFKLDNILVQVDGKTMKAVVNHGFDYQTGKFNMMPVLPSGSIVQGPLKMPEVKAVPPEKPTTKEKPKKDGK